MTGSTTAAAAEAGAADEAGVADEAGGFPSEPVANRHAGPAVCIANKEDDSDR